jgi:hypothetical protein
MTVNEEVGGPAEGASGLDPSLVSGATLLNLDSEEDGKLTVGSASSTDTSIRVEKPREACGAGAVTLSVSVSGGLGGHSGTDIAHGRANAIQCLRASRACRRARCPRSPRRGLARDRAGRPRLATQTRLARPGRHPSRLRAALRRGSDHHGGTRLAGNGRHRRPGSRPGHALLQPTDRGAALARRAGQHPDRRAILAPARRRRRRVLDPPRSRPPAEHRRGLDERPSF